VYLPGDHAAEGKRSRSVSLESETKGTTVREEGHIQEQKSNCILRHLASRLQRMTMWGRARTKTGIKLFVVFKITRWRGWGWFRGQSSRLNGRKITACMTWRKEWPRCNMTCNVSDVTALHHVAFTSIWTSSARVYFDQREEHLLIFSSCRIPLRYISIVRPSPIWTTWHIFEQIDLKDSWDQRVDCRVPRGFLD